MTKLPKKMDKSWIPYLESYIDSESINFLKQEVLPKIKFYPKIEDIFNVFQMPLNKIKIVLLGQDPYVQPNQAIGYAFAVNEKTNMPPSLKYIHKEIHNTDGISFYYSNNQWRTLKHWTDQGIFLLNTALTVEENKSGSHISYWSDFIKQVIKTILENQPCIWLLWGRKAQEKFFYIVNNFKINNVIKINNIEGIENISDNTHYILQAAHPAAEAYGSGGFIGCNHFKLTNQILQLQNKSEIFW